jgi:hypothetical protein
MHADINRIECNKPLHFVIDPPADASGRSIFSATNHSEEVTWSHFYKAEAYPIRYGWTDS